MKDKEMQYSPTLNEKQFRQQIVDLLKHTGWKCYFTWTSIHSTPGFPDIVAIKDGEILVIELKSAKGKLTESQKLWLEAFQLTCARVYEWRPSDWEEIVAVLQGKGEIWR